MADTEEIPLDEENKEEETSAIIPENIETNEEHAEIETSIPAPKKRGRPVGAKNKAKPCPTLKPTPKSKSKAKEK